MSSKRVWRISPAREPERPWAVVLPGGRAVRLRRGICLEIIRPKRRAIRAIGRAASSGDFPGQLLERHHDRRWH